MEINGQHYVDARSLLLPPGSSDGPRLDYVYPSDTINSALIESITLSASLYKKGGRNTKQFSMVIYVPVQNSVELEKKYSIEPDREHNTFRKGAGLTFQDVEQGKAIIRMTSDHETYFYGTGFITFTSFDESGGPSRIKGVGSFEFSIPTVSGDRSQVKGTFQLL